YSTTFFYLTFLVTSLNSNFEDLIPSTIDGICHVRESKMQIYCMNSPLLFIHRTTSISKYNAKNADVQKLIVETIN
ncbi:hypothetical protein L9F63_005138, partial [Diploptera punctata]